MSEYPPLEELDNWVRKYVLKAASSRNWLDHLKAHGLANRLLFRQCTEERRKTVYQIEQAWYEGRHPLTYHQHQNEIQRHRRLLDDYRSKTKENFVALNVESRLNVDKILQRKDFTTVNKVSQEILTASKECSNDFIAFMSEIFKSSVNNLSKLGINTPYPFAVIGLGSVARGVATPYSDLEYAFIVKSNSELEYFTKLAVDNYFQIGNLGESPLQIFNIQEMVGKPKAQSNIGIHIDGISPKAGHIPTGKGNGGQSLILTLEELIELYREKLASSTLADIDDLLSSKTLIYTSDGGEQLYIEAVEAMHKILIDYTTTAKGIQKRIEVLKQDLQNYSFLPRMKHYGPPDNTNIKVKSDIFRYPTLLADHIRMSLSLDSCYPWDAIFTLQADGILSAETTSYLTLVLALSIYIRTRSYLALNYRSEHLSLYTCTSDALKTLYHIPRKLFVLLGCLLIPLKTALQPKIGALSQGPCAIKTNVVKTLFEGTEIFNFSAVVKVEVMFFAGDYEGALEELHIAINQRFLPNEPNKLLKILCAVQDYPGAHPNEVIDSKILNKHLIELVSFLLCASRNYTQSTIYFKWLIDNEEDLVESIRWKIFYSDSLNMSHSYIESNHSLAEIFKILICESAIEKHCSLHDHVLEKLKTSCTLSVRERKMFLAMAYAYRTLGENYKHLKLYVEAEDVMATSLHIYESLQDKVVGDRYVHMQLMSSLGEIALENKNFPKATKYFKEAQAQFNAIHSEGTSHPDLACLYTNFGQLCQQTGRYPLALDYYTKALNMTTSLFNEHTDHMDIANCLKNLAEIYAALNNFDESIEHFNKTLDMLSRLGEHGSFVQQQAIIVSSRAKVNSMRGENQQALRDVEMALNIANVNDGSSNLDPDFVELCKNVGDVYLKLGYNDKALAYHENSLQVIHTLYNNVDLGTFHDLHGNSRNLSSRLAVQNRAVNISKLTLTNNPSIATGYASIGEVYNQMSRYSKALEYYVKSLDMNLKVYGATSTHDSIATRYGDIGIVYNNMGEYSKALEYHKKSLDMYFAVYGADSTNDSIATSYNNIGLVYYSIRQDSKALEYYTKSLNLKIATYGTDSTNISIAASYNNIGGVYYSIGENHKALEYQMKSLNMQLAVYGADSTNDLISTTYSNVGGVYDNMGEYSKALEYHKKSLTMKLAEYGVDCIHDSIAISYGNIGRVHKNMGEYNKALEYYLEALNMKLAIHGADCTHAGIGSNYNSIGLVYDSMGEYSKALEYHMKSLDMTLAIYGADGVHVNIALSHSNIGCVYDSMGEYSKALEYHMRSLEMKLAVYGADGRQNSIADSYSNIGVAYSNLDEISKALEYYMKALQIYETKAMNSSLATIYHNVAFAYHSAKEYRTSLDYYGKAINMFKTINNVDANNLFIAFAYRHIGDVYADIGEYTNSFRYNTLSLDTTKAAIGDQRNHIHIAYNYRLLGRLYHKLDQYTDSMHCYASALVQIGKSSTPDPRVYRRVLISLSETMITSSDYKHAQGFLLLALKQLPTNYYQEQKATICYLLAQCCLHLNQYRRSWNCLYSALCYYDSLPPSKHKMASLAKVHLSISHLLLHLGHVLHSLEHSQLALDLTNTLLTDQENATPEYYRLRRQAKYFSSGVYAALTLYVCKPPENTTSSYTDMFKSWIELVSS